MDQSYLKKSHSQKNTIRLEQNLKELKQLTENSGFTPMKTWTDQEQLFSLHYLSVN